MSYLGEMFGAVATVSKGMAVTAKYLFSKPVTLQYPDEKWPIPARFRGELFMNVYDCIGCLQCARACPVNCIYLETVKRLDDDVSQTESGQKLKMWLTQFDIDVSLCMVCGLCSEVCPTDCLYHTHEYEIAPEDRRVLKKSFIDPKHLDKARHAEEERAKAKAAPKPKPAPKPEAGEKAEAKSAAPTPEELRARMEANKAKKAAKQAGGEKPAAPTPEELRARMEANKAKAAKKAAAAKDEAGDAKDEAKAAEKPAAPTPEELRARMEANKAKAAKKAAEKKDDPKKD